MKRRGFTLLEATFSMALGLIVLAVGYSAYFNVTRADDVERRREMLTTTAQNAMSRIKQDVRSSSRATASGSTLTLTTADAPVIYRSSPDGTERLSGHRRSRFSGVRASFAQDGPGVNVSIRARANTHGRVIRVDLNCFVTPRNR